MTAPKRIVIVEDSATQAARLSGVLQQHGWTAICVSTAEQAIAEIEQHRPDLILLDYYLPGICGDELCRRIRENINTRGLPIIMLTADDQPSVELHGLQSGADAFVAKGADDHILLLRIGALLDKSSATTTIVGGAGATFQRARLLAIDDSLTFLEYLASELEKEGYEVQRAASAQDGLTRVAEETFDCVLVDLVMPGMDGIEVCRQINRTRQIRNSAVTVLMLTGQETKGDLTRALEAGADDFVGKSSDMAVLKGRIGALLRRKFFQEENRRIMIELKNKELETMQAKATAEAARARAALYEELQKTADELERSNHELEQFAHIVSHDLKEPLRMIGSFTALLAEAYAPSLDGETRTYVDYVTEGVHRMGRLIDDLLTYSQVGRGESCSHRVSLSDVFDTALSNLRRVIDDTGARVIVPPLPQVHGNALLLSQLAQNLLGNALKFHGPRPPVVSISCEEHESHWTLSVADNGIGIPEKQQHRVFQIFQRLHTREEYEGSGVGLAICKKIALQHGGDISIDSTPGSGTTFQVTLSKPAGLAEPVEELVCP